MRKGHHNFNRARSLKVNSTTKVNIQRTVQVVRVSSVVRISTNSSIERIARIGEKRGADTEDTLKCRSFGSAGFPNKLHRLPAVLVASERKRTRPAESDYREISSSCAKRSRVSIDIRKGRYA